MTRAWRPFIEIPAFLAAALACAWIANAAAGPTRRLSWSPRTVALRRKDPSPPEPAPKPTVAPALTAAPTPSPLAPREPQRTAKALAPVPAVPAPAADPRQLLLSRFPALRDRPEADVSGDEARWLHAHGALFLDARRTATYVLGHIPGARSLPVWEDGVAEKVAILEASGTDPELPVVLYCAGGGCEDSHLLAQKLWLAGFKNLRIYAGGFPEWEAKGWPVAKGGRP